VLPSLVELPRPWTPSYSVVVQGSPLSTPVDLSPQEEPVVEADHGQPLAVPQTEEIVEPGADLENQPSAIQAVSDDHAMTSLIESGVIVDPATLQDPDVEGSPGPDPASEAVVAALIESGVLAEDTPTQDGASLISQDDSPILSVTAAQDVAREDVAVYISVSSSFIDLLE
jgi:hypothetical protein